MHLRGETKEREAAAFSSLLYKKEMILRTENLLQLTALLLPWDKTKFTKLEPFLSTTFM